MHRKIYTQKHTQYIQVQKARHKLQVEDQEVRITYISLLKEKQKEEERLKYDPYDVNIYMFNTRVNIILLYYIISTHALIHGYDTNTHTHTLNTYILIFDTHIYT